VHLEDRDIEVLEQILRIARAGHLALEEARKLTLMSDGGAQQFVAG
jgi:hypothetical protein